MQRAENNDSWEKGKKQIVGTLKKMQNVIRFILTNFPANFWAQEIFLRPGDLKKKYPHWFGEDCYFMGVKSISNESFFSMKITHAVYFFDVGVIGRGWGSQWWAVIGAARRGMKKRSAWRRAMGGHKMQGRLRRSLCPRQAADKGQRARRVPWSRSCKWVVENPKQIRTRGTTQWSRGGKLTKNIFTKKMKIRCEKGCRYKYKYGVRINININMNQYRYWNVNI